MSVTFGDLSPTLHPWPTWLSSQSWPASTCEGWSWNCRNIPLHWAVDDTRDKWRNYQRRLRLCGARYPGWKWWVRKVIKNLHTWSWQTGPSVWTSSKAQLLVVPRVATQQKGISPWDLSSKMAASNISPDTERSLSGSRSLILTPASSPALSTLEWACREP